MTSRRCATWVSAVVVLLGACDHTVVVGFDSRPITDAGDHHDAQVPRDSADDAAVSTDAPSSIDAASFDFDAAISDAAPSDAIDASPQPAVVGKTNPTRVYVHYLPWFSAPQNPGDGVTTFGLGNTGDPNVWGPHWSHINNNICSPDSLVTVTDYLGNSVQVRDICAHSHPLIGPYDGQDPAVLEYHLLLMKLAGIDGVMIDWYGQAGLGAPDAGPLLNTSNALIAKVPSVGVKFGLIMEDYAWLDLPSATQNASYAATNYFDSASYIKLGDLRGSDATHAADPIVGVFGPHQFKTAADWQTILGANNSDALLTLYNQSYLLGAAAAGEFAWPYPQAGETGDPPPWFSNTSNYYTDSHQAAAVNIAIGVAYPGFDDFYGTNGDETLGLIPRSYGTTSTLTALFDLYAQNSGVLDGIQIATWNDFSEGTNIEPTVEEGFARLVDVQAFTGVSYSEADLAQVYRLFNLRKQYVGNATVQAQLDVVFADFAQLHVAAATAAMDCIDNPASCAL